MVWLNIIFLIFFSFSLYSRELNSDEIIYFNLLDTNNDNYVSDKEIDQIIDLVFQLIDKNNDKKISIDELNELNAVIEMFK